MNRRTGTSTAPQENLDLQDEFYCRARRRRLDLSKCLDDYLNANAFNNKRSACWRCPQGRNNREGYACQ